MARRLEDFLDNGFLLRNEKELQRQNRDAFNIKTILCTQFAHFSSLNRCFFQRDDLFILRHQFVCQAKQDVDRGCARQQSKVNSKIAIRVIANGYWKI